MRELAYFSANTVAQFENSYDNMVQFNELVLDAAHGIYDKYSREETNTIIRNQFDRILGINFKTATPMQRRQAFRKNSAELYTLIEDVILDKMVSGWNAANARFMEYVETRNLADGDTAEFFVNENSLLQVSKFAGNHHDLLRQAVHPGKAFTVETSWYGIKVYTDYELFRLGKVDFTGLVDKMYKSIEEFRYSALYTAFMGMDSSLPTDMKLETALTESTKDSVVEQIEAVKAATGCDVLLVGTRTAIQKLQNTVSYNMFSNEMKNERHEKGILGIWEGYECLALDRVNKVGTRDSVFSADDNKKIFILPVDPEFKPIKQIIEGDVMVTESGADGSKKDMTMDSEIAYKEGLGIVINQLFGEIIIASSVSA